MKDKGIENVNYWSSVMNPKHDDKNFVVGTVQSDLGGTIEITVGMMQSLREALNEKIKTHKFLMVRYGFTFGESSRVLDFAFATK